MKKHFTSALYFKITLIIFLSFFISFAQAQRAINNLVSNENPKLQFGLSEIVTLSSTNQIINSVNVPNYSYISLKDNNTKIKVDILSQGDGNALYEELKSLQVEIVARHQNFITCWVEIKQIPNYLNKAPSIVTMRSSIKPQTNSGPVQSQGDVAQRSDLARALGFNGAGVKVGVLSDSYNNLNGASAGVSTGELPGTTNPNGFTTPITVLADMTNGGSDEGRAMLEIIHDVAPGAQLYYYTAFNGQAGFADGIRALADAGCKVIVDDVGYFAEPYFQDGIIAQAVDYAVNVKGASYFSSAANSSDQSYEAPYQASTFQPFGDGQTAHNFGTAANPIYYLPVNGSTRPITFQWDEPYISAGNGSPGSASDLNIYICSYNSTTMEYTVVSQSITNNIGSDPIETFGFANINLANKYILITKKSGPDPTRLKVVGHRGLTWTLTPPTIAGIRAGTCVGHSNAAGAIACGAASYDKTPAFGVPIPEIESYSSRGGTLIMFSPSGVRLASPVDRMKPEFTAPDNANTSFFIPGYDYEPDGIPNFSGTSAAAPHAAGVAALMYEANPSITQNTVRTELINSCVDMDDPNTPGFDIGFDYRTGAGLIRADLAVMAVTNPDCPPIVVTITGSTTFCEGDSVILNANTGTNFTFQWKKDGVAISGATNAQYTAKTSGNFTVDITRLSCTLTSVSIPVVVNLKIIPTVASYSVCQNAAVPSGEGLKVPISNTNSVDGSIVSGPTYVRGQGNNTTTYNPSGPRYYSTNTFIAPASGDVTFTITEASLSPGITNDSYLTLYQSPFNPASPATNFLRGDDDGGVSLLSSLTHTLTAGQNYVLVVSTFSAGAVGTYTLQASSAGFPNGTNNWYTVPTGGSSIFTGEVFNPVGLAGSGIPNTSTIGSTNFYVENQLFPDCRTATTFTIGSVGGSVSSDATFCSSSNSGTLTLSGHAGTILRWESSTDNFLTSIPISNTTTTLNYANIPQTTKYRAVIKNGSCASANSSLATISITSVTAGSNSPVNVGGTINLTATAIGGNTYSWAGPNAFISGSQNPNIASANLGMAGVYTVSVASMNGSCTATATTNVVINTVACSPPTNAMASSNSPVNVGAAINLSSSSTGGTSQMWTGPNSFTSNAQNPTIPSATLAMAGIYTVTITSSGTCTATATTSVIVNTPCSPPTSSMASSNSPVNVGAAINLSSSSTGGTSQMWTGPNSFTSNAQNPTIPSATLAMAGIYTVTITSSGTCTATATTEVIVNVPACTASISGDDNLTCSLLSVTRIASGGISYSWSNGLGNNPTATINTPGTYTVTITTANSCTASATTEVTQNISPPTPNIAGTENLNCVSTSVTRTASGGISYSWSNGLGNNAMATISNPGTYTVTVTAANGCSATANTVVSRNISPPTPSILGSENLSCANTSVTRTATGGSSYSWSNGLGNNALATISNPGTYTVTVTAANGCTATATTEVTSSGIIFTGIITSQPESSTICQGNHTAFSTIVSGSGIAYQWQVNNGTGFVDVIADAVFSNVTSPTLDLTFPSVALNGQQFRCKLSQSGCTRYSDPAILTVQISGEAITIVNVSPINSNMTQQAVSYIVALNKINSPANVNFMAGNAIELKPGFEAKTGSVFSAKIQSACNSSAALQTENSNIPLEIVK
ncbi:PKD repeat-containing protein [Spirosomataceae bacterium TFI 002]|nr:PKD repeat-containing protein [Spirosomataceae bacterium TFI 002]